MENRDYVSMKIATIIRRALSALVITGVACWQIWQQVSLSKQLQQSPSMHTLLLFPTGTVRNDLDAGNNSSHFAQAASFAFSKIAEEEQERIRTRTVKAFDLKNWTRRTQGGLRNPDRITLAGIYSKANSVFEFGLGESTYIADYLQIPRYAGVDSDMAYVNECRQQVSSHFRFYYADIGNTIAWGFPEKSLTKAVMHYQIAPLQSELLPFDVYMVDGRWRTALLVLCFLHASARGADRSPTVLLHDCWQEGHSPESGKKFFNREVYRSADHLLDLVGHSGLKLCVYKRKPSTTDDQLIALWRQYYNDNE